MNYYPFHIGDYMTATRHLSWEEDVAYRRLLDTCYTTERPLPPDTRAVCRLVLATTDAQREAVRVVLAEFFVQTQAGWVNRRAAAEIEVMRDKQQKQRGRANKRWHQPEMVDADLYAEQGDQGDQGGQGAQGGHGGHVGGAAPGMQDPPVQPVQGDGHDGHGGDAAWQLDLDGVLPAWEQTRRGAATATAASASPAGLASDAVGAPAQQAYDAAACQTDAAACEIDAAASKNDAVALPPVPVPAPGPGPGPGPTPGPAPAPPPPGGGGAPAPDAARQRAALPPGKPQGGKPQDGKPKAEPADCAARPAEVSEPVWQDFQRLRRAKRAPLTDTALDGFRREAEHAGIALEQALAHCCVMGWQGFKADWYANHMASAGGRGGGGGGVRGPQAPVNRQEALEQRNRAVADGWMPPELRMQQHQQHQQQQLYQQAHRQHVADLHCAGVH